MLHIHQIHSAAAAAAMKCAFLTGARQQNLLRCPASYSGAIITHSTTNT
jgi:hypothetical protein